MLLSMHASYIKDSVSQPMIYTRTAPGFSQYSWSHLIRTSHTYGAQQTFDFLHLWQLVNVWWCCDTCLTYIIVETMVNWWIENNFKSIALQLIRSEVQSLVASEDQCIVLHRFTCHEEHNKLVKISCNLKWMWRLGKLWGEKFSSI